MQQTLIKPRYYTVKEIKELEHCGRDKAYKIANELPHEKRGRDIYVFAEDYENYYEQKRKKAKEQTVIPINNVYQIKKLY